jgi:hypothetical protein
MEIDEEDYRDGPVDSDILSHARTPVTLPTAPLPPLATRETQIGGDNNIQSKFEYVRSQVSRTSQAKLASARVDEQTCIMTLIPNDQSKLAFIDIHLRVTEGWAVIEWCKINQGNLREEYLSMNITTREQCILEINTLLQQCKTIVRANASMMYALDRLTDHLLKIN